MKLELMGGGGWCNQYLTLHWRSTLFQYWTLLGTLYFNLFVLFGVPIDIETTELCLFHHRLLACLLLCNFWSTFNVLLKPLFVGNFALRQMWRQESVILKKFLKKSALFHFHWCHLHSFAVVWFIILTVVLKC